MVKAIALNKIFNSSDICIGLKLKEIGGNESIMNVPLVQVVDAVKAGKIIIENIKIKDNGDIDIIEVASGDGEQAQKSKEQAQKSISNGDDKASRMKQLVAKLNEARRVYEQGTDEIMSNLEYDRLYDELLKLEQELGTYLPNSPTHNVGYEVVSALQKEKHETPMLSLDKTKSTDAIKSFIGNKKCIASWKMDGLTVVLTYNNGKLDKAVTRGNGEIGEIVTHNARTFKNLPKEIEFKGKLVLRGEAIITYTDFNKINSSLGSGVENYKNPRNLCSGSVRQLDSSIANNRSIRWFAFELVSADGKSPNSVEQSFEWLKRQGFQTVEYMVINQSNFLSVMSYFSSKVSKIDIPSDGLVFTYDDVAYGKSLGRTSKFPRHSMAFKWQDDEAESRLINIEWQVGKTGIITPVAIFEPVDIEGSTVSKASLHNLSILMETLGRPYKGEKIRVFKANMIIPQISCGEKLQPNQINAIRISIPDQCPCCGGETEVQIDPKSGVQTLWCSNIDCPAKGSRLFKHFVSRDAMNIDGISDATLNRFIEEGLISTFADIYRLSDHMEKIVNMDGFGYKSYENMINSINKSRKVKPANLINALSIPNVGLATAKLICRNFGNDIEKVVAASYSEIDSINGVGDVIASNFVNYFNNKENVDNFIDLYRQLVIEQEKISTNTSMNGVVICVTGDVYIFPNRRAIKDLVENLGGKLTGSVSRSTSYLVTNDTTSGSRKNKAAQEYGIQILTEKQFIDKFNLEQYLK